MLVTLLGVRGSTPAPGPDFVRYGGHTSCLAITANGSERPRLVLDAGTGLRMLTARLNGRPFRGSIMLSHLHWDHVQGLPFFVGGDRADAEVTLYLPAQNGRAGTDLLASSMSPPAFPITPEGLKGSWRFEAIEPGTREVEGFLVTCAEVRHKGGRTFGHRVSDGDVSMAYLSDHVATGEVDDGLRAIAGNVDVLFHDGQFLESERVLADAYGHSTVDDAVGLADKLGARKLVLTHHSPNRTDDQLDAIERSLVASFPIVVAKEGLEIPIEAGR